MTTSPHPEDRDDILFAFDQACPVPTAEQIIEWCKRHPQFASDIRDHAAISRDWAAREDRETPPVDKMLLERGFSRVQNLIFEADNSPATVMAPKIQSFKEAAEKCGLDVPKLAAQLNIDRCVLSALFNGRMLAPAGRRLVTAVTQSLQLPVPLFEELHRNALANPRLGFAKSSGAPSLQAQTYELIVETSSMTPERKKYWMEVD